jgi:Protein of unknown function (DUF2889)
MNKVDSLPGFRRRFRITPAADKVHGEVEDDYHGMSVTVHHDGKAATRIEPHMDRAPWTTCPGAVAKLRETFTGVVLAEFASRGEKRENCTHLHDLAVLAAAHAADPSQLVYDILVSDPIDGKRQAELRRNGATVLSWVDSQYHVIEPAELAGIRLDKLRAWIESLDEQGQEQARLLQWGAILAHGRSRPVEAQSDARSIGTDRCYTFQSRRVDSAKRIIAIRDFSAGTSQPLDRPL